MISKKQLFVAIALVLLASFIAWMFTMSSARAAFREGRDLFDKGRYADARAKFESCEKMARLTYSRVVLADCLHALSAARTELGDLPNAERAIREAIAIDEALHSPPRDVAGALVELGIVQQRQKHSSDAAETYRRALKLQESVLGVRHEDVGITLLNLGALELELGHFSEGKQLLERALAIKMEAGGPNDASVAIVHFNLAVAAEKTNAFPEALKHFRRSLEIRERSLPKDHPLRLASEKAVADLEAAVAAPVP